MMYFLAFLLGAFFAPLVGFLLTPVFMTGYAALRWLGR